MKSVLLLSRRKVLISWTVRGASSNFERSFEDNHTTSLIVFPYKASAVTKKDDYYYLVVHGLHDNVRLYRITISRA